MSDVDVQNQAELAAESLEPTQGQLIESRFLFVDVAALRAKQLRRGAKSRLEPAEPEAPVVPVAAAPARCRCGRSRPSGSPCRRCASAS